MMILAILGTLLSHYLMGIGAYTVYKHALFEFECRKKRRAHEKEYGRG